ncbi:MAG: hypothetical protein V4527_00660 [Pseudomonadota bacterium]
MNDAMYWTKVGAIGQVAAAIATFAAVCVSLWLARSERRANVKAGAGLRLLIPGDSSPFEDRIAIHITNFGMRAVRISNLGWRTGWLKHGPKWLKFQHAVQTFNNPVISNPRLPFDLGPGLDVTFYVSPDAFKKTDEVRDTFFCRKLPWEANPSRTKVCLMVFIIAAKAVVTRVEPDLESFLATGVIANGADKLHKARRT